MSDRANVRAYRRGHDPQVGFFDLLRDWRAALRAMYPGAVIAVDASGVRRAIHGARKVGAFGKLPGYGYVSTPMGTTVLMRNRRGSVAFNAAQSVAQKHRWRDRALWLSNCRAGALRRWARVREERTAKAKNRSQRA